MVNFENICTNKKNHIFLPSMYVGLHLLICKICKITVNSVFEATAYITKSIFFMFKTGLLHEIFSKSYDLSSFLRA